MIIRPDSNILIQQERERLWSSPREFTQTFYYLRTGRKFELSFPVARESHFITIFKAIVRVIKGETKRLIINIPPRWGKTESVIHAIAWALSLFPWSNFLYTSYSLGLAKKQTKIIRDIINMAEYQALFGEFGATINPDASAKGNFELIAGGSVYAAGAEGEITGRGAGVWGIEDFGGFIVMDDMHKPNEALSDTRRQNVIEWYDNTLISRLNDPSRTPIIFIGQRVHEADLAAMLIERGGWEQIIIPALDKNGNSNYPEKHSSAQLLELKEHNPYVFSAQYQQQPVPDGDALFKRECFPLLYEEPDMLATFITVDTAETDKQYNDATVFSFWGIHRITFNHIQTEVVGIYCINSIELHIQPKDLEGEFMSFWGECMRHPKKVAMAAIEKKSAGVTLCSVLGQIPGMRIMEIERNVSSGSKGTRFLNCQDAAYKKLISFPAHGHHTERCIQHLCKLTANGAHAHDDFGDTFADAIKIALIDKIITPTAESDKELDRRVEYVMRPFKQLNSLYR